MILVSPASCFQPNDLPPFSFHPVLHDSEKAAPALWCKCSSSVIALILEVRALGRRNSIRLNLWNILFCELFTRCVSRRHLRFTVIHENSERRSSTSLYYTASAHYTAVAVHYTAVAVHYTAVAQLQPLICQPSLRTNNQRRSVRRLRSSEKFGTLDLFKHLAVSQTTYKKRSDVT